jgi:hypothetical protein
MKVVPRTPGPAYANLQGRKPREGVRGWRGVSYGDLSAADEVCEWSRGAPMVAIGGNPDMTPTAPIGRE